MIEERPTPDFCKGLVDISEIVAAGKDWVICQQGKFVRFDITGDTGDKAAPRGTPLTKEMAAASIGTLRDAFTYNKDNRGMIAVEAMQAYIDTKLTPLPA